MFVLVIPQAGEWVYCVRVCITSSWRAGLLCSCLYYLELESGCIVFVLVLPRAGECVYCVRVCITSSW